MTLTASLIVVKLFHIIMIETTQNTITISCSNSKSQHISKKNSPDSLVQNFPYFWQTTQSTIY